MSDDTHRQSLAHYPVHTLEKLRYADTDRQGHVNNAVFGTLVEAGRVTFLYDPKRPLTPPGTQFVIAELTIRFLSELNWPGEVTVGTGVARIGNGSFVLDQVIDKGDYGWVRFIANEPCKDIAEVSEYYRRVGHLLAVAYLVGAWQMPPCRLLW